MEINLLETGITALISVGGALGAITTITKFSEKGSSKIAHRLAERIHKDRLHPNCDVAQSMTQSDTVARNIEAIKADTKQIHADIEESREYRMHTMRSTIWNTAIPRSERLSAGRFYLRLGGNGATKKLIEELELLEAKEKIG